MSLKIINSCLALSLVIQMLSALALTLSFKGTIGNYVYPIHEVNGKIFFFLAACHIYLNRNWIFNVLLQRRPQ